MNDNTVRLPTPQSLSYEPGPVDTDAAPQPSPARPRFPYAVPVAVLTVLLILLSIIAAFMQQRGNSIQQGPAITPTPTLRITPSPILSSIATTSAFMAFDESVSSLSAILGAYSIDDATLTAPVVDLELDIPQ